MKDLAFYFHVFTQIMSFFSLPVDDDKLVQPHKHSHSNPMEPKSVSITQRRDEKYAVMNKTHNM